MSDTVRLFFAAWPTPAVQLALHNVAREALIECGGRAVAAGEKKLTPSVLGGVGGARVGRFWESCPWHPNLPSGNNGCSRGRLRAKPLPLGGAEGEPRA